VRQGFILADYACRGNQAIDNRRNGVCDKTEKLFTAENAEKFAEYAEKIKTGNDFLHVSGPEASCHS
jgi:hypothetical protein